MKAAVGGVVVLRLARVAHAEGGHRRPRPVVGNVTDNGEARPAVGAVDEGVEVTAVARVKELAQAVSADGDVRRNQRLASLGFLAGQNAELTVTVRGKLRDADLSNARQGRRLAGKGSQETLDRFRRALDLDEDARGRVEDVTRKPALGRQPVNVRAEADALHQARDFDSPASHERAGAVLVARTDCRWRASHSNHPRSPSPVVEETSSVSIPGWMRCAFWRARARSKGT